MKTKRNVTVRLGMGEVFSKVAKDNGLRGRQRITCLMYEHNYGDAFAFDSNAKGCYGETLTFHYGKDADLMKSLGFSDEECKSGRIRTEGANFVVEYEKEVSEEEAA